MRMKQMYEVEIRILKTFKLSRDCNQLLGLEPHVKT